MLFGRFRDELEVVLFIKSLWFTGRGRVFVVVRGFCKVVMF